MRAGGKRKSVQIEKGRREGRRKMREGGRSRGRDEYSSVQREQPARVRASEQRRQRAARRRERAGEEGDGERERMRAIDWMWLCRVP